MLKLYLAWCGRAQRTERMALAELPCKCIMSDGISQAEQESGVSHVAGTGKTPVVFGLGLLRFRRNFQLVLEFLCLLSGYPKLANHSDVYRCDL